LSFIHYFLFFIRSFHSLFVHFVLYTFILFFIHYFLFVNESIQTFIIDIRNGKTNS